MSIEWEDPRKVLARHGLEPKRAFSQNFLVARPIVETIAEAVPRPASGPVYELGPGVGTLTAALLRRGLSVVAIERDRDMIALLRTELAGASLIVEEGDATTHRFAPGSIVVGNLPYAVTGAIFRNLVEQVAAIECAVVMIQKEVRDRLLARAGDGDYGALTVFVHAAYDVRSVARVSRGSFHPPPKVESAVISLRPRRERIEETPSFQRTVRAAFEQRRKTLRNALSTAFATTVIDRAFAARALDPMRRGETLSVEEFAALAVALELEETRA